MYIYLFSFWQHSSSLNRDKLLAGAFNRERKLNANSCWHAQMFNRTCLLEVELHDFPT